MADAKRSDLNEFEAKEMLTNPKQLLGPPLIRGKPSNLTDQVAHKLVVLGQLALENFYVKLSILG